MKPECSSTIGVPLGEILLKFHPNMPRRDILSSGGVWPGASRRLSG